MEALQLLEENITSMEIKVFGKRNPYNFEFNTSTPVSQALYDINVLILSALAGRETTTRTLNRLPEINECLDSHYEDNFLDVDAKMECVLAMEPIIKSISTQLQDMSKLVKVLDEPTIRNVPDNTKKLDEVAVKYLDLKMESEEVSKSVILAMVKYNDIINSITKNFSQLEGIVTDLEIAAQAKTRNE